jgi:ABC-type transport system involved in cytochrome c biogenesis permease subunit
MQVLLQLLNILLPLGYLLAVVVYLTLYTTRAPWSVRTATVLARGVAVAHIVYLVSATIVFRHIPVANVWEAFSFVAFALTAVYLVLEWRLRDQATGMFLLAPALFFQLVSSAFVTHTREVDEILRSPWFGFHVTAALLGYAAFAIAAVYGLLYLLLYSTLKGNRVGLIFQRLPNLEILARLNVNALIFGWGNLTLAIIIGVVWVAGLESSGQLESNFLSDPQFYSASFVWVLYSICLAGRYALKWPSRYLAGISMVAFGMLLASSFVVNLVLESFHSFG